MDERDWVSSTMVWGVRGALIRTDFQITGGFAINWLGNRVFKLTYVNIFYLVVISNVELQGTTGWTDWEVKPMCICYI